MTGRALLVAGGVVFAVAYVMGMTETDRLAVDGPFIAGKIDLRSYDVSASTLPAIEAQMNRRGPQGYWAYTRTHWDWDDDCNVTFRATVTMPKLTNRTRLDADELAEWDRMIAALKAHEMQHVEIGRGWAAAIKDADCDPKAIDRINNAWGGRDATLDRQTRHGRTDGVFLKQP